MVASDDGGPQFNSGNRHFFILTIFFGNSCKDENKEMVLDKKVI